MNNMQIIGRFKKYIVWATEKTIAKGWGPMYIQVGKNLKPLTEKQKDTIVEYLG